MQWFRLLWYPCRVGIHAHNAPQGGGEYSDHTGPILEARAGKRFRYSGGVSRPCSAETWLELRPRAWHSDFLGGAHSSGGVNGREQGYVYCTVVNNQSLVFV